MTTLTSRVQKTSLTAGSLALLLTLAGCGGGSNSVSAPPAAPAVLSASGVASNGLTATLAESAATVPAGGSITFTLTLTNNTQQPITYEPIEGDDGAFLPVGGSVRIANPSGQSVFPPSTGVGNNSGLVGHSTTILPGHSVQGTDTIGGVFTTPGSYSIQAGFSSIPGSTNTLVGPLTVTVP